MHSALERTASSKAKILPCVCKIENCPVLAKFGGVVYTEGSRYFLYFQLEVQCIAGVALKFCTLGGTCAVFRDVFASNLLSGE